MNKMKNLALLVAAFMSCVAAAQSTPAPKPVSEAEKIEALIASVEKSAGLRFIRNGKDYDGAAAGKHLRDKWSFAGERIHTAHDFIDGLASKSSLSGKPYRIRYADGREENSADYFNRRLAELEKVSVPPVRSAPQSAAQSSPKSAAQSDPKSAPSHPPHHAAHSGPGSAPHRTHHGPKGAPKSAPHGAAQSVPQSTPAAPVKKMSEAEKIEALIRAVETAPNMRFIRNGQDYDGAAAGKHLRDKLKGAGSRVTTARDFIDKLANRSLQSGKPYQIRYRDGRVENSREFLNRKHAELEKGK